MTGTGFSGIMQPERARGAPAQDARQRRMLLKPLAETPLQTLLTEQPIACGCGRSHAAGLRYVQIGRDATRFLPEALKAAGAINK